MSQTAVPRTGDYLFGTGVAARLAALPMGSRGVTRLCAVIRRRNQRQRKRAVWSWPTHRRRARLSHPRRCPATFQRRRGACPDGRASCTQHSDGPGSGSWWSRAQSGQTRPADRRNQDHGAACGGCRADERFGARRSDGPHIRFGPGPRNAPVSRLRSRAHCSVHGSASTQLNGLLAPITAIVGASVGANLCVIALDVWWDWRARDRCVDVSRNILPEVVPTLS